MSLGKVTIGDKVRVIDNAACVEIIRFEWRDRFPPWEPELIVKYPSGAIMEYKQQELEHA